MAVEMAMEVPGMAPENLSVEIDPARIDEGAIKQAMEADSAPARDIADKLAEKASFYSSVYDAAAMQGKTLSSGGSVSISSFARALIFSCK